MNRHIASRARIVLAGLMLGALASPGCFWSGELAGIRRDFEAQVPGSSFDRNIELSFGPVMLGLAKMVTTVVPGANEARPWLRGVSRVQIGVYRTDIDSIPQLRTPRRLQSLLDDGWETAVRIRERSQAVWILYRSDGPAVREIFVVVMNDEELVLVKARGRLEKLLAAALDQAHGRGFHRHDG